MFLFNLSVAAVLLFRIGIIYLPISQSICLYIYEHVFYLDLILKKSIQKSVLLLLHVRAVAIGVLSAEDGPFSRKG